MIWTLKTIAWIAQNLVALVMAAGLFWVVENAVGAGRYWGALVAGIALIAVKLVQREYQRPIDTERPVTPPEL